MSDMLIGYILGLTTLPIMLLLAFILTRLFVGDEMDGY